MYLRTRLTIILFQIVFINTQNKKEGKILMLNEENFQQAVNNHDQILILFSNPGCQYCEKVWEEFQKIGPGISQIAAGQVGPKVAAINCTQDFAAEVGLVGYPTLRLYLNQTPYNYYDNISGPTFKNWINQKTQTAIFNYPDIQSLKRFISQNDQLVLYFNPNSNDVWADSFIPIYKTIANHAYDKSVQGLKFIQSSNLHARKEYNVDQDTKLIVITQNAQEIIPYRGELDFDSILRFVVLNTKPLISNLNQEVADRIFQDNKYNLPILFILSNREINNTTLQKLSELFKEFRDTFYFISSYKPQKYYDRVLKYLGFTPKNIEEELGFLENMKNYFTEEKFNDLNFIIYQDINKKFLMEEEATISTIKEFINSYLSHQLKVYKKCETLNTTTNTNSSIRQVNTETIEPYLTQDQNVLIYVEAEWCKHCNITVIEQIQEEFNNYLTVVRIDGSKNDFTQTEIKYFPTLLLKKQQSYQLSEVLTQFSKEAISEFLQSELNIAKTFEADL